MHEASNGEATSNADKVQSLLKQLTLVVLTRNRQADLEHHLKVWARWPVHILCLDGSDSPAPLALDHSFSSLRIHRNTDFLNRFSYAIEAIQTKYAMFLTDDDLQLPYATAECLSTLESDPTVACVGAYAKTFDTQGLMGNALKQRTFVQDDWYERVVPYFSNFGWSFAYGVMRTTVFTNILTCVTHAMATEAFRSNPNINAGYSFPFEFAGIVQGKLLAPEYVTLLKRINNPSENDYRTPWWEWIRDVNSRDAITAWSAVFIDRLSEVSQYPVPDLHNSFAQALQLLELHSSPPMNSERQSPLERIADYLRPSEPKPLSLVDRFHHGLFYSGKSMFRGVMRIFGKARQDWVRPTPVRDHSMENLHPEDREIAHQYLLRLEAESKVIPLASQSFLASPVPYSQHRDDVAE